MTPRRIKSKGHTDGWLYVGMGVSTVLHASFGNDEAYKYMPPYWVFYIRVINDCVGAACLALKTYRSRAFADAQDADKPDATTTLLTTETKTTTAAPSATITNEIKSS